MPLGLTMRPCPDCRADTIHKSGFCIHCGHNGMVAVRPWFEIVNGMTREQKLNRRRSFHEINTATSGKHKELPDSRKGGRSNLRSQRARTRC